MSILITNIKAAEKIFTESYFMDTTSFRNDNAFIFVYLYSIIRNYDWTEYRRSIRNRLEKEWNSSYFNMSCFVRTVVGQLHAIHTSYLRELKLGFSKKSPEQLRVEFGQKMIFKLISTVGLFEISGI